MKLVIVAATGGIGRLALQRAMDDGHQVVAVVRDPGKLPDGVSSVKADLMNPDPVVLGEAMRGADAVVSGLGPAAKSGIGVAATGTRAIVEAMRTTGVQRLVVVSAAPVGTVSSPARPKPPKHDPGEGIVMRHLLTPVIKRVFRDNYRDLAEMEDVLRASGLEWTVVRPPRLLDKPAAGYRTAVDRNVRGGAVVSRADVADYLLVAIGKPETVGHTIG
ncbi:MAG: NAD(P)-dependent oxidoreductase, partial [Stackebrandtia sp.]